jgi:hypothetical protein
MHSSKKEEVGKLQVLFKGPTSLQKAWEKYYIYEGSTWEWGPHIYGRVPIFTVKMGKYGGPGCHHSGIGSATTVALGLPPQ